MSDKMLTIFAPAKINLYLHIIDKRKDGYHFLESLVTFADIGDTIRMRPSDTFNFSIEGPYSASFHAESHNRSNLIIDALDRLSELVGHPLNLDVTLVKELPLASGIGGGSADAAAAIWGALKLWDVQPDGATLHELLVGLGADVPVCYAGATQNVSGIGDILEPVDYIPELPVVLVNPGKACMTHMVFMNYKKSFSAPKIMAENLDSPEKCLRFLLERQNDLHDAACEVVPEIDNVIHALQTEDGCHLARLSGSGATCFAIYNSPVKAQLAVQNIRRDNPDWWARHGTLGRTERY